MHINLFVIYTMIYLRKFNNNSTYEYHIISNDYKIPHVYLIKENRSIDYKQKLKYNFVDMGLPSGILWCDRNVGATSIYDRGLYFAWGETIGYKSFTNDKKFTPDDYKFSLGSSSDAWSTRLMSKYNYEDGSSKYLDKIDNAVRIYQGPDYDIPNAEDTREIMQSTYTTHEWVTNYNGSGINGTLFTSKLNGNTLFFPVNYGINNGAYINFSNNPATLIWTNELSSNNTGLFSYMDNWQDNNRIFPDNEQDKYYGMGYRAILRTK